MPHATIIVPCYNEEKRLDGPAFLSLLNDPDVKLLFVNDGSHDATLERLQGLAFDAPPGRVHVLSLERRHGKAEAVRHGLLHALAQGADVVGYADADLATPVDEIRRLLRTLRDGDATGVIASRVAMLGRHIDRRPLRHYLGRVFATMASLILRMTIYDTQCGTKVFRKTPSLEAALAEPFLARWVFDVELIGRLVTGGRGTPALSANTLREEPLYTWRDVPGSKLRLKHMVMALSDLVRIHRDLQRRRAESQAVI